MKQYLILLAIFLYTAGHLYAQKQGQALIDSLLLELPKAREDTNKVILLNLLSFRYNKTNIKQGIKFGQQALNLAQRLNWKKGQAKAYNMLGQSYSYGGDYSEALRNHLAGLRICEDINYKKELAESYNGIGIAYIYQGKYTEGLKNLFDALKIKKELNDKQGEAYVCNNIGAIYTSTGSYPDALKSYSEALKILDEIDDKKNTYIYAGIYSNIGLIYSNEGNYPEALKNHLSALKLHIEIQDYRGESGDYNNIAMVNSSQSDYIEAQKNNFASLKLSEQVGNKTGIALSYNNLASVYHRQKKFDEALKYAKAALNIGLEIGNKREQCRAYSVISNVYMDTYHYAEALENNFTSLNIAEAINDTPEIAAVYGNIAIIYIRLNKFKFATKYSIKELELGQKMNDWNLIENANSAFCDLYTGTKQLEKALAYYKAYEIAKDSLTNKERTRKMTQLQDKFNSDRREDSIKAENSQQIAVTTEKNKKEKEIGLIFVILIFLIIGFGFYIYWKRQKYITKQQKLELEHQTLIAQLDTHFIGDTIDSINGFVEDNDKKAASEYLLSFSRLIRTVLGNSLDETVTLKDDLENLDNYIRLAILRFPENHVTIDFKIDKEIDLNATIVPPMILQVLASNAIRHAFNIERKGKIQIEIYKKDNIIHCIVSDNGIGRNASHASENTKRKSYGSGIAEKLMKIWAESKGKTTYEIKDLKGENGLPLGTRAEFSFPFISNN